MAAALAVVVLDGCTARPAATPVDAASKALRPPPLPLPGPSRFFFLPSEAALAEAKFDPDGTRRVLVQGVRFTIRPDGAIERGSELLPYNNVSALELPDRLGGGFVFHARTAGDTLLWRTDSWTSKLVPLGRLGFTAERIVAGFGSLLVHTQGSYEIVALDPENGQVQPSGLPSAPGYRDLAFADPWLGVVDVPIRGTLASFDAGASWYPLMSGQSHGLQDQDGRILIRRDEGSYTLDPSGRLLRAETAQADTSAADAEETPAPAPGPMGREPLRATILHGWPDSSSTAVVAAMGNLGRVRLSDGKILDVTRDAFPAGDECHGVPLGGGFGFVCGTEHGSTSIHAFEPPLSLRPVLRLREPRYVASSANGALVIRGGCQDDGLAADTRYCVIAPTGVLREIRVRGDHGVERVVALHDGRAAVIVPPRFGAAGQVTLVAADGSMKSAKMKLPKDGVKRAMVRKGLWLDGFVENPKGDLAGWVAAGGPFAGITVSLDGKVEVGIIENEIERAMLSGRVGLVLGRSGVGKETTDGGFTWNEVDFPVDVDAVDDPRGERGCSRVGCVQGNWVRVGWRSKKGRPDLVEARPPKPIALKRNQEGRWLVKCTPTAGRVKIQAPPVSRMTTSSSMPSSAGGQTITADTVQSTPWLPFRGVTPPRRAAGEVGFDHETRYLETPIHAYGWGPRAADWARVGRWMIRGIDPFALRDSVWSTAVSRSPWSDVVNAARAFGQTVYGQPTPNWAVTAESSGRGGVLFMTESSGSQVFLFEANRSILEVRGATGLGVSAAAGAVKTRGRWYIATERETFRVFELIGDKLELLGDYPLLPDNSRSMMGSTIVRNRDSDALAIWVRTNRTRGSESEWFIYPIDPSSGALSEPVVIDKATLGATPPACTSGDTGWVLVGAPPVSPFVDVPGDERMTSTPRSIKARLLAGVHGLCLEALSGELDAPPPERAPVTPPAASADSTSVSMVVSDRSYGGSLWEFRCTR